MQGEHLSLVLGSGVGSSKVPGPQHIYYYALMLIMGFVMLCVTLCNLLCLVPFASALNVCVIICCLPFSLPAQAARRACI